MVLRISLFLVFMVVVVLVVWICFGLHPKHYGLSKAVELVVTHLGDFLAWPTTWNSWISLGQRS